MSHQFHVQFKMAALGLVVYAQTGVKTSRLYSNYELVKIIKVVANIEHSISEEKTYVPR